MFVDSAASLTALTKRRSSAALAIRTIVTDKAATPTERQQRLLTTTYSATALRYGRLMADRRARYVHRAAKGSTMKAITVKYSMRSCRYTATDHDGNKVSVRRNNNAQFEYGFDWAALALCEKMLWQGDLLKGWGGDGVRVYTFATADRVTNPVKLSRGWLLFGVAPGPIVTIGVEATDTHIRWDGKPLPITPRGVMIEGEWVPFQRDEPQPEVDKRAACG